ncbi:MAG: alcohol dehydrogenase catalytic domain-containing protein [Chloroflexota bacterium]
MKAGVFKQDELIVMQDVAKPKAEQGEALVRVLASGICGSDLHAWHGHDARRRPPLILGHEVAGVVEQGELAGQLVTMNPMICCEACLYCKQGRGNLCLNRTMIGMTRPGGFAQYLTIPNRCLIPVTTEISPITTALTEPLAVCIHAINLADKHSHHHALERKTLIIGAGAIGLITALTLIQQGYSHVDICDTNKLRVETAEQAFHQFEHKSSNFQGGVINNLEQVLEERYYDIVFDAVGSAKTREISLQVISDGGCIIHLGLQQANGDFDARRLTIGEIAFIGAFTYTQEDLQGALSLLEDNALGALSWVDVRPLDKVQQSFEDIHHNSTSAAKIILVDQ